ncbi:MAG: hypothetical protein EPN86_01810 [Nanoarchaeota archaeon]|nr:MAG: hypothetical protein EPN86_01810 [Nanoarchaeota archaeon]
MVDDNNSAFFQVSVPGLDSGQAYQVMIALKEAGYTLVTAFYVHRSEVGDTATPSKLELVIGATKGFPSQIREVYPQASINPIEKMYMR